MLLDLCISLLKLCFKDYFIFHVIKQALVFCLCFQVLLEAKLSILFTCYNNTWRIEIQFRQCRNLLCQSIPIFFLCFRKGIFLLLTSWGRRHVKEKKPQAFYREEKWLWKSSLLVGFSLEKKRRSPRPSAMFSLGISLCECELFFCSFLRQDV